MESLDEKNNGEPIIKFIEYFPNTTEFSYYGKLKTRSTFYKLISNNNRHKLVNHIPKLKQTIINVIKEEMKKYSPKEETDMKKITQGDLNGISIIIYREDFEKSDYSDYDSEDSDIENSVGSYKLFEDTTDKLYKGLSKFLNNIKKKETKILNKQIKNVDSDSDYKYIYFNEYNMYVNFQIYDGSDLIFYMMRDGYDQKMKRRKERKEEKRKEYQRYLNSSS